MANSANKLLASPRGFFLNLFLRKHELRRGSQADGHAVVNQRRHYPIHAGRQSIPVFALRPEVVRFIKYGH